VIELADFIWDMFRLSAELVYYPAEKVWGLVLVSAKIAIIVCPAGTIWSCIFTATFDIFNYEGE